jgi:UDP-glucose 4-epimerase
MSKILVTGGAGFMGSWLVDELLERGHDVTSVDDLSGGYLRNVNKDCKFVRGDVRNTKLVNRLAKGKDVIFHLAAYAAEGQSVFSPISINEINLVPMNNLLVAAVNNNVEKIVFTSSMAVYGSQKPPFDESMPRLPEDPYGAAKTYCETMLEVFHSAHGLRYTIIRPHNVYGPRQNIYDPYRNVLGIWMNRVMKGKPPIIYGDGKQTRAFSYIENTTKAIANAGFFRRSDSQIINVGDPKPISVNDACDTLLEIMNSRLKPIYVKARPQEVKHAYSTTKKSERLLGYRHTHDLSEGLTLMEKWARKMGPKKPTYVLPLEIKKGAPEVWRARSM